MSLGLVAYGSSDEGEESDEETLTPASVALVSAKAPASGKQTTNNDSVEEESTPEGPLISDEEDDFVMNASASKGLRLPPPKAAGDGPSVSNVHGSGQSSSVLSALPAPKSIGTLGQVDEGELEDIVKPKAAELQAAEKPPPKKKKTIKITVPRLNQYDSDDSDDEQPKKKVKLPTKGKSGLFALLPEPKNMISKETGRALIPHAISKKGKQPIKPTPKPVPNKKSLHPTGLRPPIVTTTYAAPQEDSDDDDTTGGNFFSFGDDSKDTVVPRASSVTSSIRATLATGPPTLPSVGHGLGSSANRQDAPLQFKSDSASSSLSFPASVGPSYPASYAPGPPENTYEDYQTNVDYNQAYSEQVEPQMEIGMEQQQSFPDDQLLRLQGKNKRGREEINIIDVNVDTKLAGSSIELTKGLTEESDVMSYSRKKKDQPSSTQKRKHQITYLAHKAKERELELKNSWAENRLTKKQTQAKYGF